VVNDPNQVEFNPAILWQCQAPSQVVKRAGFADPRIKAVIAVNPVSTPIFTVASMRTLLPSQAALHRTGQPMQFLLRRELAPVLIQSIDPDLGLEAEPPSFGR
jgi:hypothetical protein